jgi:hypothetical protein
MHAQGGARRGTLSPCCMRIKELPQKRNPQPRFGSRLGSSMLHDMVRLESRIQDKAEPDQARFGQAW